MKRDDFVYIARFGFYVWMDEHAPEALNLVYTNKVVPKERPRTGKGGHVYTPTRTRKCEDAIAKLVPATWRPLLCPVKVTVKILELPPKWAASLPEHLINDMAPKKGDLDNKVKTITDALNGLAYKDDDQIRHIDAKRSYGNRNECVVTIERWGLSDHEARQIAKFL